MKTNRAFAAVLLAAVAVPLAPLRGAITITVYRDYNGNGSDDGANEPGVAGLTLTAYDGLGGSVAGTDLGAGSYSIPTGAGTYRVELTGLPTHLKPGSTGPGSLPAVTFANDGAALAMGVQNPAQHTQSNPRLALACYEGGTGVGNTGPALVSFPYDSDGIPASFSPNPPNGTAATPRKDGQVQDLGSVWGTAWQPVQERLFIASFLKRYVGFADGPGYFYVMDYSGATPSLAGQFNLQGLAPGNGGAAIDLGSVTRTSVPGPVSPGNDNALSDDPTEPSWDLDAFGKVGTISFGDADLTEDGKKLWIVNLNQNALIEIDATLATGSLPGTVNQYVISSLPGAPTSSTGLIRPWALKFHDGVGYLGVVDDASTSELASDLEAIVLSFDPGNIATGFTEVLRFGLDYNRENGQTGLATHLQWQFWADHWTEANPFTNQSDNNLMAPQPILADLEFAEDGSMVIGMMDRFGHQNGRTNYPAISSDTNLYDTNAGGDLLHACLVSGSFVIEGGPGCPTSDNNAVTGDPTDTLRQDDGASNNGEYYYEDHFEEGSPTVSYTHGETATGSLALLLGTREVVTTHYDPIQGTSTTDTVTNSQGVVWHDTALGTRAQISGGEHTYMVVGRSPVDASGFAKSNGLGDLELLVAPPAVEIGDYVWHDVDKDGVQDPGEPGISGVTVNLYDMDGGAALVGTAVTSGSGGYLFGGPGDVNMTSGSLLANRNYELRIALSDVPLGSKVPTVVGSGTSLNDSDGVQNVTSVTVAYLTGDPGENDHSLDFGFTDPVVGVGNLVFRDLDNNGIYGGLDIGIESVTVEIYGSAQTPGVDPALATARTDPTGCYFLELPAAGLYILHLPAENFQGGGALDGLASSTGVGGDQVTDDDGDENGVDGGDPTLAGVSSTTFSLLAGGMPINESGKGPPYSGPLPDNSVNYTMDFGLRTGKPVRYDAFIVDSGLTLGTADGQQIPDASGGGGNPDGDWQSNLLEHALCDTPNSGVPNHPGFCIELTNAATGQIDASFERPQGVLDVIYTLEGSNSMLGPWFAIGTIAAGAPAAPPFTASPGADGTETVTYANVQNDVGYTTSTLGFARLSVSLDVDQNGTPDTVILPSDSSSVEATDHTRSFGWQCVVYNSGQCASFSHPYTNKPVFTGVVDSNTASSATVDASGSAGGVDLATLTLDPIDLDPGPGVQLVPTHYLQVTSGTMEGERFDVASASGGVLTLVNDPDIFTGADPTYNPTSPTVDSLNTSDSVPGDNVLVGASFQVLPHKTIDQLFDKNGAFAGLESTSDETRLLFYHTRHEVPGFASLSLADTGIVKWIYLGDPGAIDQGARPVDRCTGNYIHLLAGGTTLCGVGLLADYDLGCAFNAGYTVTGSPYPINQTPNGTDGRAMVVGSGASQFQGAGTPGQASELLLWMGDMTVDDLPTVVPYMEGYETFMAADDGGSVQRWVDPNDASLADFGTDLAGPLVLNSWRALTVKILPGNTLEPHIYPLPTSP